MGHGNQSKILKVFKLLEMLSLDMQCPCPQQSKKWRKCYNSKEEPLNHIYPIDDDKVGFQKCQSGISTNFLEFYKHLYKWESKCLYYEAMFDIVSEIH